MIGTRKYNGKTWEEWDETEYDCPQEGCGGETSHVEEGYFQCNCGWFGQPISIIEDLKKEVKRFRHELLLILNDFQTKGPNYPYMKHDMYKMRNRIETILKGEKEMIK